MHLGGEPEACDPFAPDRHGQPSEEFESRVVECFQAEFGMTGGQAWDRGPVNECLAGCE
jgi:hypothetical protein